MPQAFGKLIIDRRLIIVVTDVQRARVLRAIVFLVLFDQYAEVVGLVGYFIHHVAAPSTLISPSRAHSL
ncbi:MAG: hypothetical protein KDA55_16895 [Planctomycetales bacterium]|nr:hypothetical protein [Planctomycetales bacterium]